MDMRPRLQAEGGLAYAFSDGHFLLPLRGLPNRRRSRSTILVPVFPQFPRGFAPRVQLLELLPVLEGIHASPVTIVLVGKQLFLGDQALEWFLDQLFTILHVIEDLVPEDEKPAVDQQGCPADGLYPCGKIS